MADRPAKPIIGAPAYAQPARDVVAALGSDAGAGLDPDEAAARLTRFGPNALPSPRVERALARVARQFANAMVVLLAGAAVLSLLIGERLDAAIIAAIVLLNATFGAWQEGRAKDAAAAVRGLLAPVARVVRGGEVLTIDAAALVPGDVVLLAAGDRVPADGRLLEASRTEVDEASLTGESAPVSKRAEPPVGAGTPLAARTTIAFAGTTVTRGRARLLVTSTGSATELGRIAELGAEQRAPTTPLQRRLSRLAGVLLRGALTICLVLAAVSWIQGSSLGRSLLIGVALAVAAVPEGLPAVVTLTLALGMRRLAERGAIVRRLAAVETLGSTTVICTDKTGTLTANRMAVTELVPYDGDELELLGTALIASELAGDPGERAIAEAATAHGIAREALLDGARIVGGEPFDGTRKRMSVAIERGGRRDSCVKGAPEVLVGHLRDPSAARIVAEQAQTAAVRGLRVLLVARGRGLADGDDPESELEAVGLIALSDPPRPGVRESVERARAAGVRTIMATGDHPSTARAVAFQCGIVDTASAPVVLGEELDEMADDRLDEVVASTAVYARVVPEHKLRIVEALHRRGEVVAMTGDGVNDVPALVRADIGVAMGRTGSDAASDAADMVLADDDYSTIVAAIERGRTIYQNIVRFSLYLLAANTGELLVFTLAIVPGFAAPLTVLQILMVNLLTDGAPALALGVDPAARGIMRRPPRAPSEGVIESIWRQILLGGILTGAAAFASFLIGRASSHDLGRTMAFTTLVCAQLSYIFAVRGSEGSLRGGRNRALLAAVVSSALVAVVVLAVPPLAHRFGAVGMSPAQLTVALALSLVPFAGAATVAARRRPRR
jgi:Ca2+-transporting ATPase